MRAEQIDLKIADLKPQEKYTKNTHKKFEDWYIMKGSVLSVNVIDARDLVPKAGTRRLANAQVKMSIEGQ